MKASPDGFRLAAERELGALLRAGGFVFVQEEHEATRNLTTLFYRSGHATLAIYEDSRNGEINLKVASPAAPLKDYQSSKVWFYLPQLAPDMPQQTTEQLLAAVPTQPLTTERQLRLLSGLLEAKLASALAALARA